MKKYYFLLSLLCLIIGQAIAQKGDMVLSFAGEDVNTGNLVLLDSVFIENLSQGGDTTVYGSAPHLYLSWISDINELQVGKNHGIALSANYPNPFNYHTHFNLLLQHSEHISISLMDVSGKIIAEYQNELCKGLHNFEVHPGASGVFLLKVSNGDIIKAIKLLNEQKGINTQKEILHTGIAEPLEFKTGKLLGDFSFQPGDQLAIKAMAENYQDKTIYDNPYNNKNYTFELHPESIVTIPTVTTTSVSEITSTSAIGGGNVINNGGAIVTARGVCWSTSQNPTIADDHTVNGNGTGVFISSVTGLLPNTTYHIRAYASNTAGIAYGDDIVFNTLADEFFTTTYIDYRQVLLEEFTGHLCVNCPEASKLAHDLSVGLSHRLIVCGIHAGYFAEPVPGTVFNTDYTNSVGNTLFNDFGIFANPVALIDRVEHNGLYPIFLSDWETVVMNELEMPNIVNMQVSNTYFPESNEVKVEIGSEFVESVNGQFKLAVYIVEDSLVSPQLNNDPDIGGDTLFNYVHRNVLRDAVSPVYGEFLGDDGNITVGEIYENEYTYSLDPDWVAGHCRIIAFIGKLDAQLSFVDIVQTVELEIINNTIFPVVSTGEVSSITGQSAVCGGFVSTEGADAVTARGVCWNTDGNPDLSDQHTFDGIGTGSFVSNITDLTANTTYFVRAYATNSFGTSYGEQAEFTTTETNIQLLYLIGSATSAGWNNQDTSLRFNWDYVNQQYYIIAFLTAGADQYLKALEVYGQWAPQWGTDQTGNSQSGPLVYRPTEQDPDPYAIPAPDVDGDYLITFDLVNLFYTIEPVSW